MGLQLRHPLGLAAGLDKDATAGNALSCFGFSWLELGTVTPLAQAGNPLPRLFRLTEHEAIINRMGFNSVGLEQFIFNLRQQKTMPCIGINIGKNHATPVVQAINDYRLGMQAVYSLADYITINISSPN
ncbi:unnamed protein product, partial [marine sediment metagenome]